MVAASVSEAPVRKKVQIKAAEPDEEITSSENDLRSVIGTDESGNDQDNYLTLESDLPVPDPVTKASSEDRTPETGVPVSEQARHGGKRDNESGRPSDKQSV